ncbi:DUF5392 family protein [Alkalihalobacillus hemicellulosilyticus]|uniref:Uncharacterized protein n=1 Tax=Halalkalibacter hemicellulosilyticusJCM 9152 TaxID=1236971 RepID=W4QCR4_9BACI|nr:DUF5392 family protein [Halalkalibacter hemicellulosilyticus]GAE29846.1 hypothetical protein JCM9152_1232 [Halalkalibacter hemicellulosilyticusJCM 9152]
MSFKANQKQSPYIAKELEKIQSKLKPFMKKSTIYTFISMPLITFSMMHLGIILFQIGISQEMMLVVVIAALSGAFGLALFKESMHVNKQMFQTSVDYMTDRILKSTKIPDQSREQYLDQIHTEPMKAVNTFCLFLEQEERIKKIEEGAVSIFGKANDMTK